MMVSTISRTSTLFLTVSLLFLPSLTLANDGSVSSDYDAGKRFAESTGKLVVEYAKKNLEGIVAIQEERSTFLRSNEIEWMQGVCDGLIAQDIPALAAAAGLDQQGAAHACIFYYATLGGVEGALKTFRGETPVEAAEDEFYIKAAEAVFNDSSEERIEELKGSFYYLSLELQDLAQAAGMSAE